jgi:hypothetical protein
MIIIIWCGIPLTNLSVQYYIYSYLFIYLFYINGLLTTRKDFHFFSIIIIINIKTRYFVLILLLLLVYIDMRAT